MADFDRPSHWARNATLVVIAILIALLLFALTRGSAPQITAKDWPEAVGRHLPLDLTVRDGMGVRQVKVFYRQDGKELPVAAQASGGRHWLYASRDSRTVHLQPKIGGQDVAGLKDGPAQLVVQAQAGNLRGSRAEIAKPVVVRTRPPRLAALSTQQYIHQGGCEMVIYRLFAANGRSSQTDLQGIVSGVEMAGHFFPGYPLPGGGTGVMFSLFAYAYNAPAGAKPRLVAHDRAGNETTVNFPVRTFPEKFRTRVLDISDAYIARVVPPILAQTPQLSDAGSALANFLLVNRTLRRIDAAQLVAASHKTVDRFLWHGSFLPLAHAAVEADFADHRIYKYHGKVVDHETHLGFDLAVVRHTPVLAANDGKVIWARYFGIYGNSILIDHGFGLMSLYAHLNDFAVKAGDTVQRGQLIAHSDSTGLAGGDHLHYSMLLDGVQVNPMEWWDPHWVHNRITAKLTSFGGKSEQAAAGGR